MGPRTARISAEDFVIPAEFGGLRLAEHSAGQIGGVHLSLRPFEGRTVFGPIYQQVPLRVLPPFQLADEPACLVYLLNPTAGLLDGDGHLVEVVAERGTRAVITGQSATRVHPAVSSFSTQQWRVQAEPDSQLVLLPGPNIPFRGCRYHQKANLDLEGNARVIWGDIWTPGRYARLGEFKEFYAFDRVVQDLEIRRDGVLVYRDRFSWEGPWEAEDAIWYLGANEILAIGGLFVSAQVDLPALPPGSPIRRAVLPLPHGDTLIRWVGPVPELTAELVRTALHLAAGWSELPDAPAWLIGSNNLVPNHWFSVPA
jgi:urease accessory protein